MNRAALSLLLVLGLTIVCCAQTPASEESLAISHGPYLQHLREDSVTIVWMTNKDCVSSVQWGLEDPAENTAIRSRHGLIDAHTKLHSVRIEGLSPGTQYVYRVESREIAEFRPYSVRYGETIVSEPARFTTLDTSKESFSFYEFKDIHENADRLERMFENLNWDNIDLVFYNGDTINYFQRESQIFDGFLDVSVRHFARETPFVYVRGNHDARGLLARTLMDYFPSKEDRFYFSFNHGPVHFTVLDSGEDKPDSNREYGGLVDFDRYRTKQTAWLRKNVQTDAFKNALYRVVVLHIPPYVPRESNLPEYRFYGERQIAEHWLPILNEAGVDLMLCGHRHRLIMVEPGVIDNTFPIIIGSNVTTTRVDVTPQHMTVLVKEENGNIRDRLTLRPKK